MSSVWDGDFKVPMKQESLVGIWSCQVSLAISANEALKAGFFLKKIDIFLVFLFLSTNHSALYIGSMWCEGE